MKPVVAQPVEQAQVSLPPPPPDEKPAAPPQSREPHPTPQIVEPPAPAPAPVEESATEEPSTTDKPAPSNHKSWGKPTSQIWIGSPPDDISGMFPAAHREKIKEVRTLYSRASNFKYAIVFFNNVEEATAAIETLNHPRIKYGEDYSNAEGGSTRGHSGRGGGSFGQGTYDSRKSGGSDTEGTRGGFGRGGRGGRGGNIRGSSGGGSSGSFGSRGSGPGSPAPRGRGRGAAPSKHEVSGDKQEWSDKPESKEAGWPNEERPPVVASTSDEKPSSPPAATPNEPHSAATADATLSTGAPSSTAGESQS